VRISFELHPVDQVAAWGSPDDDERYLSWFGLTDGYYWIDLGGVAAIDECVPQPAVHIDIPLLGVEHGQRAAHFESRRHHPVDPGSGVPTGVADLVD